MADWREFDSFPFGDSVDLADELGALVLAGTKTATCGAASEGLKGTEVGKRWVMLDSTGRPRAVLETLELTQRRFDGVDERFAFDEGEDNRTLASWRAAHRDYFSRRSEYAPDMLLNCERFRLVTLIDEGERR